MREGYRIVTALGSRWIPEALSRLGAQELADGIEEYWCKRGYMGIRCRLEPVLGSGDEQARVWAVRSNIGPNGYPPKALESLHLSVPENAPPYTLVAGKVYGSPATNGVRA